jgi:hypothetical protein
MHMWPKMARPAVCTSCNHPPSIWRIGTGRTVFASWQAFRLRIATTSSPKAFTFDRYQTMDLPAAAGELSTAKRWPDCAVPKTEFPEVSFGSNSALGPQQS